MMLGSHGFMAGGFMWIFWVLIVVGLVLVVKWIVQQNRPVESRANESPLEILKKRYARGEIDKAKFEEKKKELFS
jgi:putative membrane protein